MNKEVNYILQGFLLMLLIIGAIAFIRLLLPARFDSTLASVNASQPSQRVIVLNSTGKALFKDNCEACHSVWKEVDGPSMFTIEQRIPDKQLLYDWIRNSSAVLKSGNKYFNTLVSKYGGVRMPDFLQLTDNDVTAILQYIRQVDTLRTTPSAIAMD
jgi:mono/diheme cytochrome c family protein